MVLSSGVSMRGLISSSSSSSRGVCSFRCLASLASSSSSSSSSSSLAGVGWSGLPGVRPSWFDVGYNNKNKNMGMKKHNVRGFAAAASAQARTQDYYELLGVPRGASSDEIKKAYRDIAKKNHPDVNGGDEAATQRFRDAQKAYDVLRDENKRRLYDNFGEQAAESGGADMGGGGGFPGGGFHGGFPGGGFPGGFSFRYESNSAQGNPDIEELLEQFFGGGGPAGGPSRGRRRGADVSANLEVSFDECLKGASHNVVVEDNSGGRENVELNIPAGVEDGDVIVLEGRGGHPRAGRNGQLPPDAKRGNLHITLDVRRDPNRVFERNGANLTVTKRVSYASACLGTIVDLPVVPGQENQEAMRMRVPAGIQHGTTLRVENRGLPVLRRRGSVVLGKSSGGRRGDLYVRIAIDVPQKLSAEQRALLEQLQALEEGDR